MYKSNIPDKDGQQKGRILLRNDLPNLFRRCEGNNKISSETHAVKQFLLLLFFEPPYPI